MPKFRAAMGRDLYDHLEGRGLLEYGAIITADKIQSFLEIVVPETGTKQQFDEVELCEFKAIDYIRNTLLGQGKYLAKSQGSYRILLPSENAVQCDRYISSASKKLNRSLKLSRNTPPGDHPGTDRQTVRALMHKAGTRKKF